MSEFDAKTIVVTGATGGIGNAIARAFARAGAHVVLWDLDDSKLRSLAGDLGAARRPISSAVDVSDRMQCLNAARAIEAGGLPPASVLVQTAAILLRGEVFDGEAPDAWDRTIATNLGGTFNAAYALLSQLKQTRGSIVNFASIQSFVALANSAAYTAAKGGVAQLTKALALELGPHGVRVNAVAPGPIRTPMTSSSMADAAKQEAFIRRMPLGRVGEPEDLVGPVMFLASSRAAFVTGAILPVDGGWLAN